MLCSSNCTDATGTLPSTLASAFVVGPNTYNILQLSGNQLVGTLPAAWGAAGVRFGRFSLAQNYLSGPLPDSGWGGMVLNSSDVDLSRNSLSGPIHAGWFPTPPALAPSNTSGGSNMWCVAGGAKSERVPSVKGFLLPDYWLLLGASCHERGQVCACFQ
jgi:hypothetical protein